MPVSIGYYGAEVIVLVLMVGVSLHLGCCETVLTFECGLVVLVVWQC